VFGQRSLSKIVKIRSLEPACFYHSAPPGVSLRRARGDLRSPPEIVTIPMGIRVLCV
jgi:hypothetical protein